MKGEVHLYYTSVDGTTQEKRVQPMGLAFIIDDRLPAPEWCVEAYDLDGHRPVLLRLAGCDFTQGAVDGAPTILPAA